jgi:hypothetical protein
MGVTYYVRLLMRGRRCRGRFKKSKRLLPGLSVKGVLKFVSLYMSAEDLCPEMVLIGKWPLL